MPSRSRRQVEHEHRFVEAGVGVHVRAEPRAGRFERRDQLARLEMRLPLNAMCSTKCASPC